MSAAVTSSASLRLGPQHPWPGLASFSEHDQGFFHGRDREADDLARLVRRERLTVLFGRSGLGKTSLLCAGLFPRLREDLHVPVLLRIGYGEGISPREQVWRALADACAQWQVEAAAPRPDESLWEFFHRAGAGFWNHRNRPVLPVLVFDQFEELFTLGEANETAHRAAAAFVEELTCLVEDRPLNALREAIDADPARGEAFDFARLGCKVVVSFREDFLAEVESLRHRMPAVMRNRYRLLPMNGLQAREVIAGGKELVDADVSGRILGLAWRNRSEAPAESDMERIEIDPALLSVICTELNLRRVAAGRESIGAEMLALAEREILVDFYERSLQGLDVGVRQLVEDELITSAGYRDSRAYDDALARPGVTPAAVQRLVDGRLLRVDDRFGVRRLELTHDVLTRVVKASRDARRAREVEATARRRELEALALQRRNRRNAALVAAAALGAVVLMVVAGWAVWQAGRAQEEARRAREEARVRKKEADESYEKAQRALGAAAAASYEAATATRDAKRLTREALGTDLIVQSRAAGPGHDDLALLLAAEAVRRFPERLDAQFELLARLLTTIDARALLRVGTEISAVAVARSGRHVAFGTSSGEIVVATTMPWQVIGRWQAHAGDIDALVLSPDASRLVSMAAGDSLAVWAFPSGKEIGRTPSWRRTGTLAVSPDNRLVGLSTTTGVEIWDLPPAQGARSTEPPPQRNITTDGCLAFTADGKQLVYLGNGLGNGGPTLMNVADRQSTASIDMGRVVVASTDCSMVVEKTTTPAGQSVLQLRRSPGLAVSGVLDGVAADDVSTGVFSADGRQLALRGKTETTIWSTSPLRRIGRHEHEDQLATAMSFSPDGRWLATTTFLDGRLAVRNVETGEPLLETELRKGGGHLIFAPDSASLLTVSTRELNRDRAAEMVWDLRRDGRLAVGGRALKPLKVRFLPGSPVLLSEDLNSQDLQVWNGRVPARVSPHASVRGWELSPDGTRVALREDREIRVVDIASRRERVIATIEAPSDHTFDAVTLSGDNRTIAIALNDGRVWVRPVGASGSGVMIPAGTRISALAFNAGNRVLALGGFDGRVRIARLEPAVRVTTLAASHQGGIVRLAFSSNGRFLASGAFDRVAIVHEWREGRMYARFEPHENEVNALDFIEGGQLLVAGNSVGGRAVWDLARRQRLATLGGEEGPVASVSLSATGRRAAVVHRDETVSLRSWDNAALVRDACAIAGRNLTCAEWRQGFPNQPYRQTCSRAPVPDCGDAHP